MAPRRPHLAKDHRSATPQGTWPEPQGARARLLWALREIRGGAGPLPDFPVPNSPPPLPSSIPSLPSRGRSDQFLLHQLHVSVCGVTAAVAVIQPLPPPTAPRPLASLRADTTGPSCGVARLGHSLMGGSRLFGPGTLWCVASFSPPHHPQFHRTLAFVRAPPARCLFYFLPFRRTSSQRVLGHPTPSFQWGLCAPSAGAGPTQPRLLNDFGHFFLFSFRRTSSQRTVASKTNLEETIVQPRVP